MKSIKKGFYKDRPAWIVENDCLALTILPQDGAKVASIRSLQTGREMLAEIPGDTYRVLTYEGNYVDAECCGFDDMFPTVDPWASQEGPYARIVYPDHGETCRLPFEASVNAASDVLTFKASSRLFEIDYKKEISFASDGEILVSYSMENHGKVSFPFLWAGHCMFRAEEGMRVLAPFASDAPIEMMFAPKNTTGKIWSRDQLYDAQDHQKASYKFYYLEPMTQGRIGIAYADQSAFVFRFDPQKLPYLGVWMNNGEFKGIRNIALEPAVLPFDSPGRAQKRGYSAVIDPGKTFSFTLDFSYEMP